MRRLQAFSLVPTIPLVAFLMFLLPVPSHGGTLDPKTRIELTTSGRVTAALVEALDQHERVVAKVFFLTPATNQDRINLRQSVVDKQVSPVVLDLAQAMLSGKLSLADHSFVQALYGTADAQVVQRLLHNPQVLSLDLDETSLPESEADTLLPKTTCVPSSTRACVAGGRFSLNVYFSGGTPAGVATSSPDSAAFWFSSSTNWEVLAKVLNGCSINNHYWVFGAGATSQSYVLDVGDTVKGTIIGYPGVCPILDTTKGFPCT